MARKFSKYARTNKYSSNRTSQYKAQGGLLSKITPAPNTLRTGNLTGAPSTLQLKLKYHQFINSGAIKAAGDAGDATRLTMRISNPSDPYQTGTGHQPMLWDEYSALYDQCVVRGCLVEWTFTYTSGAGPIGTAARGYDSAVGEATIVTDEYERSDSQCGMICPETESCNRVYRAYYENWKIAGAKNVQEYEANPQYWIAMSNSTFNPTKENWWTLNLQNYGNGETTGVIGVTLTYYCKLHAKKSAAQS